MRRYFPINEMNNIDNINNDNCQERNFIIDLNEDENLNESNKIEQFYDEKIKRIEKLEVDSEIPLLEENIDNNLLTFLSNEKKKKNEKEINEYILKIFSKELSMTYNDSIGFFRSCYLIRDF